MGQQEDKKLAEAEPGSLLEDTRSELELRLGREIAELNQQIEMFNEGTFSPEETAGVLELSRRLLNLERKGVDYLAAEDAFELFRTMINPEVRLAALAGMKELEPRDYLPYFKKLFEAPGMSEEYADAFAHLVEGEVMAVPLLVDLVKEEVAASEDQIASLATTPEGVRALMEMLDEQLDEDDEAVLIGAIPINELTFDIAEKLIVRAFEQHSFPELLIENLSSHEGGQAVLERLVLRFADKDFVSLIAPYLEDYSGLPDELLHECLDIEDSDPAQHMMMSELLKRGREGSFFEAIVRDPEANPEVRLHAMDLLVQTGEGFDLLSEYASQSDNKEERNRALSHLISTRHSSLYFERGVEILFDPASKSYGTVPNSDVIRLVEGIPQAGAVLKELIRRNAGF